MIAWCGRQRHPQDVGVLVLERTGQVVVDLVEAQRQRLARSARAARRRRAAAASNAASRSAGGEARAPGARDAGRGRQVERLEHERRDPPRAGAAVVGGVRQDQLVAGPGHRDVAQPALLGERRAPGVGGAPRPSPAGRRQRLAATARRETGRRPCPGRKTTGNSRPLALWTVRTATASASGSSSAVAGSSPASISVCEVRRDEDRAVVGEQRGLGADDLEEPGDVRERLLGGRPCRSRRGGPACRCRAGTGRAARRPVARGRAPA